MNRFRFPQKTVDQAIKFLKSKKGRAPGFISKFPGVFNLRRGKLYAGKLRVVPTEDRDEYLREVVYGKKSEYPFGRDSLFAILKHEVLNVSKRDIESFLWDDEILQEFCDIQNSPESFSEIQLEKQSQLQSLPRRGMPADDIKAISDSLYNKCKRVLNLHGCGNTAEAFSIEHLAPLIQPGMAVYEELAKTVLAPLRMQDK